MKRVIAAIAAAILVLPSAGVVFAGEESGFSLTTEGTEIVAEYRANLPSSALVSFLVLPPQAYDMVVAEASDTEIAQAAVYFDQIRPAADGVFRFRADVGEDGISGRYRTLAVADGAAQEASVLYLKQGEDIAGIVEKVNRADAAAVRTLLEEHRYLLDINGTYHAPVFAQYADEVIAMFMQLRGNGFADQAALKDAFDRAGMFVFANNTADADALYTLSKEGMSLEKYGLDEAFRTDYERYCKEAYRIVIEIRKEQENGRFIDEAQFLRSYREALGVCKINAITVRSEMTAALQQYEPILALGLDGAYAKADAVEVAKTLIAGTYQTRAQLKRAFDAAVAAAQKISGGNGNTGGGNRGGGSSGGGGGGTAIGNFGVSRPEQQEAAPTVQFSDLQQAAWADESIRTLAAAGVVNGYPDQTFRPLQQVTREEFVKMVILAAGIPTMDAAVGFDDVDASAWYAPYIAAAVQSGLVNGVDATRFGVGQPITRQDMATIVSRVLRRCEVAVAGGGAMVFDDEAEISDYAKDAVFELQRLGIINGDEAGRFLPKEVSNRAQTAKVIAGMMRYLNERLK